MGSSHERAIGAGCSAFEDVLQFRRHRSKTTNSAQTVARIFGLSVLGVIAPAAMSQVHFVEKIFPQPPMESRSFGVSAAIDGSVLVVGADESAFVFEQHSGLWVQVASFSEGGRIDRFGRAVACTESVVLVSMTSSRRDVPGRCFVYERAAGQWQQAQILQAKDGHPRDDFGGWGPAIEGNTALIGAPRNQAQGNSAGAFYVFERDPKGRWVQTDKILPPDAGPSVEFGHNIAMKHDWAVVAAPFDNSLGPSSGAVYIYERDLNGVWQFVTKLLASDGMESDLFGISVAIDDALVVVGASHKSDSGNWTGAAYVFKRGSAGEWEQLTRLEPRHRLEDREEFGSVVAIDGDVIAVATDRTAGRAYVFEQVAPDQWEQTARLATSGSRVSFGDSVAVDRDTIVIGDPGNDEQASSGGAVYIFERSVLGELNCDLSFDAFDVEPFVLALFDPQQYRDRYPDCDIMRADINQDGTINALDIAPFLERLFERFE